MDLRPEEGENLGRINYQFLEIMPIGLGLRGFGNFFYMCFSALPGSLELVTKAFIKVVSKSMANGRNRRKMASLCKNVY